MAKPPSPVLDTRSLLQRLTPAIRADNPGEGDLALIDIVALPSRQLSARDRKAQIGQRKVMLERWLAFALPDEQIIRLCVTHFACTEGDARRYMRQLRAQFLDDAKAIEQAPTHERRHVHRVRLTHLFNLAVERGNLTTARMVAQDLIKLDAAWGRPDDESGLGFIPDEHQAARGLSMEQLLGIVENAESLRLPVPEAHEVLTGDDEEDDDELEDADADG